MLKTIKIIAYALVLIGALNWGLVGVLQFDLVAYLFGDMTRVSRIIYALVGLSALTLPVVNYIGSDDDNCQC